MKHSDLERGDPVEVELDGVWVPATVVRVIVGRGITLQLRDGSRLDIPHASQVRPVITPEMFGAVSEDPPPWTGNYIGHTQTGSIITGEIVARGRGQIGEAVELIPISKERKADQMRTDDKLVQEAFAVAKAAYDDGPSEAVTDAESRGFAVGREHAQYLIEERDAEIERLRAVLAGWDKRADEHRAEVERLRAEQIELFKRVSERDNWLCEAHAEAERLRGILAGWDKRADEHRAEVERLRAALNDAIERAVAAIEREDEADPYAMASGFIRAIRALKHELPPHEGGIGRGHRGHVSASRASPDTIEEVERLRAALEEIAAPFPAVVGSSEDMLEDWMSAAARMKATAREALAD